VLQVDLMTSEFSASQRWFVRFFRNPGKGNMSRFGLIFACIFLLLPIHLKADTLIETSNLSLVFNDVGSLVQAKACFPSCQSATARQLDIEHADGIISFAQDGDNEWVQRRGLPAESKDSSQQLHFTRTDGQSISWKVPAHGYLIEVTAGNTGPPVLRAGDRFRARPAAGFGAWLEQVRYVTLGSDGVRQIGLDQEISDSERSNPVFTDWAGFRNRFWAVLVSGETESDYDLQTGEQNTAAVVTRLEVKNTEQHLFYLGPVEPDELLAADELLADMLYAGLWFWLRWICFALYYLLGWIQSVVPVWGLAIMLLSLLVSVLMSPLSKIADRVQKQVGATEARLAPDLSRIKQEYRGEEQANKILALYKSAGVHPLYTLKSMLGVALVIPVFVAAFNMLAENIHLLNTSFLWMADLSRSDALTQLPFSLPFFGSELNLLPFLMTVLSIGASWLQKPLDQNQQLRARQLRNMLLMAVVFFVLFYTFPAGMVLYWTTNNVISVVKSLWTRSRA
jgi:YidC/Oxa1 family membrane protein insertase